MRVKGLDTRMYQAVACYTAPLPAGHSSSAVHQLTLEESCLQYKTIRTDFDCHPPRVSTHRSTIQFELFHTLEHTNFVHPYMY